MELNLDALVTQYVSNSYPEIGQQLAQAVFQNRTRLDWTGELRPADYDQWYRQHSRLPGDFLTRVCTVDHINAVVSQSTHIRPVRSTNVFSALSARTSRPNMHATALAQPSSNTHLLLARHLRRMKTVFGHMSSVYCVAFDCTGTRVFTGADDFLVKMWSTKDGRLLASLRGHDAEVTDLAISGDNRLLASSSNDHVIRLWNILSNGDPICALTGHSLPVMRVRFSPDWLRPDGSRYLLSASTDGTCRRWDCSVFYTPSDGGELAQPDLRV